MGNEVMPNLEIEVLCEVCGKPLDSTLKTSYDNATMYIIPCQQYLAESKEEGLAECRESMET